MQFIDAHCHADLLLQEAEDFPEQYRKRQCGGISWSYKESIPSWRDYPQYWEQVRSVAGQLREQGLDFYYLVGIHPRCIPEDLSIEQDLPKTLIKEMNRHVNDPLCLGLGEIGLDKSSALEVRVLRWHLDFALLHLPYAKRIGVHTPRANKEAVTRDILNVLRDYASLKERVLVDHVSPKTYHAVRQEGFFPVGMTVQKGKTTVEGLLNFMREEPGLAEAVILNSDSASEISGWFLQLLDQPAVLGEEQWDRLLLRNARQFYGI